MPTHSFSSSKNARFVVYDFNFHAVPLLNLCMDYFEWMADELISKYDIDVIPAIGMNLRDYVENNTDEFISLISTNGVLYLLEVDNEIVGMGGLRRLKDGVGEIKRMYIKPEYQGEGLGKELLKCLLSKGKEFGFSAIYLETGAFMTTAQHLYRSVGFRDREMYPETEVPLQLQHVWLFMEKRI